jgi:hypothetical protein
MPVIGLNPTIYPSLKFYNEVCPFSFTLVMPILFASSSSSNRSDDSWMGNQAWTEALEWPGAQNFHSAVQKPFNVKATGQEGGVYKTADGLTFMRVWSLIDSLILGLWSWSYGSL